MGYSKLVTKTTEKQTDKADKINSANEAIDNLNIMLDQAMENIGKITVAKKRLFFLNNQNEINRVAQETKTAQDAISDIQDKITSAEKDLKVAESEPEIVQETKQEEVLTVKGRYRAKLEKELTEEVSQETRLSSKDGVMKKVPAFTGENLKAEVNRRFDEEYKKSSFYQAEELDSRITAAEKGLARQENKKETELSEKLQDLSVERMTGEIDEAIYNTEKAKLDKELNDLYARSENVQAKGGREALDMLKAKKA